MCVVSMVMEHQADRWDRRYFNPEPLPIGWKKWIVAPMPTPEEIEEFRSLLERAREYDKRNNEPDCEMAEKRQKLLDMAAELGVDISFI